MILLSSRRAGLLDRQLNRSRHQQLTYQEVGQTRAVNLPAGYRHDRITADLEAGEAGWEKAKEAIRQWKLHGRAGITITPSDAPTQGSTVLASRRFGSLLLVIPCRVVYVTDEPDRFGFAYGTLPGHPEQGEEAFHVLREADGKVSAEIVAFSRAADLPTKLAGPVARQIQKAVTRRYLQGFGEQVHQRS